MERNNLLGGPPATYLLEDTEAAAALAAGEDPAKVAASFPAYSAAWGALAVRAFGQGDAITADPIVPANTQMTTGLVAPDGIVGTIPSFPGAPAGSTIVLYTEKILSYFIVGTVNGAVSSSGKFTSGNVTLPAATINYTPSVTTTLTGADSTSRSAPSKASTLAWA